MSKPLRDLRRSVASVTLRCITLASKFLLTLAIARFLSPRELGLYGMMSAGLGFGVVGLGLEFYAFAMREIVAAPPGHTAAMVRDQFVLFVCGSCLMLPLAALAFALGLMPAEIVSWFFILVVFEYLSHEATRILVALARPIPANLVLFVRSGVWVYAWLAVVVLDRDPGDLDGVFRVWLGGTVASLAVAGFAMRDLGWRRAAAVPVDWRWVKRGALVARPFIVTAICALGVTYVDRFFIEAYDGVAAVGVYTFFSSIAIAVHTLVHAGVLMLRIPRLIAASSDAERFRREIRLLFWATLGVALAIAAAACIAIFPVLALLGQPAYDDHVGVFFVLLTAAVLLCVTDVPVYALYASRRDVQMLVVNMVGFAVAIVANLGLVPRWGALGAAWASVAAGLALGAAAVCVPRLMGRGAA